MRSSWLYWHDILKFLPLENKFLIWDGVYRKTFTLVPLPSVYLFPVKSLLSNSFPVCHCKRCGRLCLSNMPWYLIYQSDAPCFNLWLSLDCKSRQKKVQREMNLTIVLFILILCGVLVH